MPQGVERVLAVPETNAANRAIASAEPANRWYAACTSPRHEKRVAGGLAQRGIEHFLPLYHAVHRWKNGVKAQLDLPLFPGYIFVRIHKQDSIRVLDTPGVLSFVGSRLASAQLPDHEIETLRSGLHLRSAAPFHALAVGEPVRIKSGPLAGLTGVLVRHASSFRVVLTVNLISQSVAVEVNNEDVESARLLSVQ